MTVAKWRDYEVAKSVRQSKLAFNWDKNIDRDIRMLKALSYSPHIVQLIGHCGNASLVTEYHPLGNLLDMHSTIRDKLAHVGSLGTTIKIALSYLECMTFLHELKPRPLLICDSCTLIGFLKQFLITKSLQVVFADLDSVVPAKKNGNTCRCKYGNLRSPEEIIPNGSFVTEKRDIWRTADVIRAILGSYDYDQSASVDLQHIYELCRLPQPADRPDMGTILRLFRQFARKLNYY